MVRITDHKQRDLFDPWRFLSPKRRRKLDENWPGLFKKHLLEELPVDKLLPYLTQDFGRPSKELYTLLGVLIFQQIMNLTDIETIDMLAFNTQWHYALNITEESDQAKYISEKTLFTWRQIMIENDLETLIFDRISIKLGKVFNVNTDEQRLDSVHIKSNMRKLGRIGIFSNAIHRFLINLKRHHQELFDAIPAEVVERYISDEKLSAFSMVKPSESGKTLKNLSHDLFDLIGRFKDHDAITNMKTYKLMQRVLNEQCNLKPGDDGTKVTVKPPKEVASDSLQNPSDPDATYSGHKGQGYQVQVMETFTRTEDKAEKDQTLNLITHVSVEKASTHDVGALLPAIKDAEKKGLKPKTVSVDTHYGSDDNLLSAKKMDVDIVSPANGSQYKGIGLSEFKLDENGYVTECPNGKAPQLGRYKKKIERFNIRFAKEDCQGCPLYEQCPTHKNKKFNMLSYGKKDLRLALRRIYEKSDAFIDNYRWRAGVEATMSEYNTRTGVKRLRVRGFKQVRFCAVLKAAGVNIMRAARSRKARIRANGGHIGPHLRTISVFSIFKEQLCKILFFGGKNLNTFCAADEFYAKSAA